MIKLTNINKYFISNNKRIDVLKNVNIQFPDHGLISIVGKSGSGKTTLLNRILANQKGYKVAVIVNDIGEVNVDANLIEKGAQITDTSSIVPLTNGCICCTLGTELIEGLIKLEHDTNPEWVVIEATGVACPGAVVETIKQFMPQIEEIRTAVLCDAERLYRLLRAIVNIAPQQVADGQVLLLNKIDLVDEDTLKQAEETLREFNQTAPIFRISAKQGIDDAVFAAVIGG